MLKLFEAIHIVLGLLLCGLAIHKRGAILILTAEDSPEMLIARLRSIAQAMQLSDEEIAIVMRDIRISDVSGSGFRLTEIRSNTVKLSDGIDQVVEACQKFNSVVILVDPAVSFGVGESRVNDAEQGLIEAARRLKWALNCCVQYIHHSGKQNARDKVIDQYAGHGGSAFADGARMVHVLQSMTPGEWLDETGTKLGKDEAGLRLARPKMSYCAPVEVILIRRKGYYFGHVARVVASKENKINLAADQVLWLLVSEFYSDRYHSKNTLEQLEHGVKRRDLRATIDVLLHQKRLRCVQCQTLEKVENKSICTRWIRQTQMAK